MLAAYSRLRFLLDARSLTRAELQRRITAQERAFNVKTLYRLADPDRPLERVDLRAAGAICRALGVGLEELIVFSEPDRIALHTLPEPKQRRLDQLMEGHNEGRLAGSALDELRARVDEAELIARSNARQLAAHRRSLRNAVASGRQAATG